MKTASRSSGPDPIATKPAAPLRRGLHLTEEATMTVDEIEELRRELHGCDLTAKERATAERRLVTLLDQRDTSWAQMESGQATA